MSLLTKRFTGMSATKMAMLILALVICIVVGIESSVTVLTKKPEMQSLLSNLSVTDVPKVIDVLDENKIWYRINPPDNVLYVSKEQSDEARAALESVGIVVESPK
ncbi:MAG: hypothetical protein MJK04_00555 [Psychrosphaera sp.]|nr:hypothetical protein [Psychrosphaera sp.]